MFYLGTIQPSYTQWNLFPNSSVNGKFVRVTFQPLDELPLEGNRSFLLLRRYWANTTPPSVETAKKIYPTNNAVIIYVPVSDDYLLLGLGVCDWQCKLGWRKRDSDLLEPAYTVSLEEE